MKVVDSAGSVFLILFTCRNLFRTLSLYTSVFIFMFL